MPKLCPQGILSPGPGALLNSNSDIRGKVNLETEPAVSSYSTMVFFSAAARIKQKIICDAAQYYVFSHLKYHRSEFHGDLQRQLCPEGSREQFQEPWRVKAVFLWSSFRAAFLETRCPTEGQEKMFQSEKSSLPLTKHTVTLWVSQLATGR